MNIKTFRASDFDFVKILFCLPADSPFYILKVNKEIGLKHVEIMPPKMRGRKENLHFISVLNFCRGKSVLA